MLSVFWLHTACHRPHLRPLHITEECNIAAAHELSMDVCIAATIQTSMSYPREKVRRLR